VTNMENNTIKDSDSKKKEILKMGWLVALGMVVIYLCTIVFFWVLGITEVKMHMVGFVSIMILYPIIFFWFGIKLVLRKKFFPDLSYSNGNDEE